MEKIGLKIKNMRFERNMTLKDLSEKTDLSVSFLSQIERGSSSLAITSLKKIADAFNVPMSHFFEEVENHNYVTKKEEQKPFKIEGSYAEYVRMAGQFPDRKLEPMKVTIAPNQPYTERFSHHGEEFYYVLKVTVTFKVKGQEYILNEGESINFPSEKEHQWANPTSEEAVLLSVLTPVIF